MAQFESFTRMDRNRANETLWDGYAANAAASPNERITNPTSKNLSAFKRNRRLTPFMMLSLGLGIGVQLYCDDELRLERTFRL
jgi:hypothetical protein